MMVPDAREPMRSEKRMRAGMSTVGGQAAVQQPLCSSCDHCASRSSASDCTRLAGLPPTEHAKHAELPSVSCSTKATEITSAPARHVQNDYVTMSRVEIQVPLRMPSLLPSQMQNVNGYCYILIGPCRHNVKMPAGASELLLVQSQHQSSLCGSGHIKPRKEGRSRHYDGKHRRGCTS